MAMSEVKGISNEEATVIFHEDHRSEAEKIQTHQEMLGIASSCSKKETTPSQLLKKSSNSSRRKTDRKRALSKVKNSFAIMIWNIIYGYDSQLVFRIFASRAMCREWLFTTNWLKQYSFSFSNVGSAWNATHYDWDIILQNLTFLAQRLREQNYIQIIWSATFFLMSVSNVFQPLALGENHSTMWKLQCLLDE